MKITKLELQEQVNDLNKKLLEKEQQHERVLEYIHTSVMTRKIDSLELLKSVVELYNILFKEEIETPENGNLEQNMKSSKDLIDALIVFIKENEKSND